MYYRIQGLVLRENICREADKLITLYTIEWGKILAIVPGAKKVKAKLSAGTEPLTESDIVLYQKKPSVRPRVTGVKILYNFSKLKYDWRKFIIAQYCSEVLESLTPFRSQNFRKYDLLVRTWKILENAQNPVRILMAFNLRFLKLSGYSFVDYLKRESSHIPKPEKDIISKMAKLSGEDVDRNLEMNPEIEKNIKKYLDGYLNIHLPRPLNTGRLLKSL